MRRAPTRPRRATARGRDVNQVVWTVSLWPGPKTSSQARREPRWSLTGKTRVTTKPQTPAMDVTSPRSFMAAASARGGSGRKAVAPARHAARPAAPAPARVLVWRPAQHALELVGERDAHERVGGDQGRRREEDDEGTHERGEGRPVRRRVAVPVERHGRLRALPEVEGGGDADEQVGAHDENDGRGERAADVRLVARGLG